MFLHFNHLGSISIFRDFNEILTAFGWPFIVTSVKKSIPKSNSKSTVADVKGRLEGTVQHLLFLQLPYPLHKMNYTCSKYVSLYTTEQVTNGR